MKASGQEICGCCIAASCESAQAFEAFEKGLAIMEDIGKHVNWQVPLLRSRDCCCCLLLTCRCTGPETCGQCSTPRSSSSGSRQSGNQAAKASSISETGTGMGHSE